MNFEKFANNYKMRNHYPGLNTYSKVLDTTRTYAVIQADNESAFLYRGGGPHDQERSPGWCNMWNFNGRILPYTDDTGTQKYINCTDTTKPDGSNLALLECTSNDTGWTQYATDCCPMTRNDINPQILYDDATSKIYCEPGGGGGPSIARTIPNGTQQGWCQDKPTADSINNMRAGIDTCWSTCANKRCDDTAYIKSGALSPIFDGDKSNAADGPVCPWVGGNAKYCARAIDPKAFTKIPNTQPDGLYGCISPEPGTDFAWASWSDQDKVKNYCYYNDNCVGYYDNGGGWYVATNTDPLSCTKLPPNTSDNKYQNFYRKNGKPDSNWNWPST
jgi:hypothetical protein